MSRQNRTSAPFSAGTTPTGTFGTASMPASTPTGTRPRPSPDAIRKRAYELYCARKGQGGTPEDDWLRAERELMSRD